jgi:hypothetical protein
MSDDSPEPHSLMFTKYAVNLATTESDGTISVPVGGIGGATDGSGGLRAWNGFEKIRPDHRDYRFWAWLLKRWPYRSALLAEDLPTLKEEYDKGVV